MYRSMSLSAVIVFSTSENLTIEHLIDGPIGFASFFISYPLKNRILCTNSSVKKFIYKYNNKKITIDIGLENLLPKLFESIKQKSTEIIQQYFDSLLDTKYSDKNKYILWKKAKENSMMVQNNIKGRHLIEKFKKELCSKCSLNNIKIY